MLRIWSVAFVVLVLGLTVAGPLLRPCVAQDKPVAKALSVVPKADLGKKTTCAVCGMKVRVKPTTPAAEYEGKNYYFCSKMDQDTFLHSPEKFAKTTP